MMNYRQWPEYFPENCPPLTASNPSGKFYRFVKKDHESPQSQDFLSWRENNQGKPCPENITECQACGLSVYASLEEISRMAKVIPRLRKMKIAEGNLDENSGKIQNTPSRNSRYHYTWWVPDGGTPWKIFVII
jgi:hypothetical protein